MGVPTYSAINTNYGQRNSFIFQLNFPFIGAMTDQTAGMSTGTRNQAKVEGVYCIIVKILRNMLVVFCLYCYHNSRHGISHVVFGKSRNQTLVGLGSAFLLIVTLE